MMLLKRLVACVVTFVAVFAGGAAAFAANEPMGQPHPWQMNLQAGVTPVPLNVPEVLPNLNTGAINLINAPSLAAEQLQWASKLDTINEDVSALAIGALVMSSKRIDALPADLKTILIDTGRIAANALTKRIRAEDDAAFNRMKGKMTVVSLSADQKAKFEAIFKQVRQRLAQGTFPAALVRRLEGMR